MSKRRFKTNILVRNNRIKIMQEQGLFVKYSVLSDEEYLAELKKKIIEESNEVAEADDEEELKLEIADVLEVIENILEIKNITFDEIQDLKIKKQNKIGKFDNRYKTYYVEMDENNESLDYYLSKPNKYPEIAIEEE